MPYAVFEDDEKLSRAFPTKQEALRKAEEAGLVVVDAEGKPVLDKDLTIRPCPPDPDMKSDEEPDRPDDTASPGNPRRVNEEGN